MLTVQELLLMEDEQFVRRAYQSILGREADEAGSAAYLRELRNGIPKVRLLVDLVTSEEARRHAPELEGWQDLVSRERRHLLARVRDRLWRLIFPDGASAAQENRALRNDLYRRHVALEQRIDGVERLLAKSVETQRVMFGRLINRLEATEASGRLGSASAIEIGARVVFNLTTSQRWNSRAVGIIRVERELAAHLATYPDTIFVVWDNNSGAFHRLSRGESAEILRPSWLEPNAGVADFHELRSAFELEETDIFVSVGLDWDLCPIHRIAPVLKASGCRSVFACYDLVPILFPEYCVEESFDQRFKRHFVDMVHVADSVFSISDNSQSDLSKFWNSARPEVEPPPIRTIPLANLQRLKRLPTLTATDTDRLRHIKANSPYVLYVSSIEARKNHRLLLGVWRDMFLERQSECPLLVLVGMSGWGTHDLLAQMRRSPVFAAGKIIVLHDVGDDFLLHLYRGCAFSVFPSEYEGWGLAATEAMAFGKACLISDAGALNQAAQGLMPALHPRDHTGWKTCIERLLDDPDYLHELEAKVHDQFVFRQWADVSAEFAAFLRDTVELSVARATTRETSR